MPTGYHVHANGIRQHYLRYGGDDGDAAGRDAVVLIPGITSPAVTWGFVAEHLGRKWIGIDIDVRNKPLQDERLRQPSLDLDAA